MNSLELLGKEELLEKEKIEEPITTEKYWDCECEENYIHPKNVKSCSICGANAEDQPDSLIAEVRRMGLPL